MAKKHTSPKAAPPVKAESLAELLNHCLATIRGLLYMRRFPNMAAHLGRTLLDLRGQTSAAQKAMGPVCEELPLVSRGLVDVYGKPCPSAHHGVLDLAWRVLGAACDERWKMPELEGHKFTQDEAAVVYESISFVESPKLRWLELEMGYEAGKLGQSPPVEYLGDGLYQCGRESLRLDGMEKIVLETLVGLRAATKPQLENQSGYGNAVRLLRAIVRKYPMLANAIVFPSVPHSGGYSTTIVDGQG